MALHHGAVPADQITVAEVIRVVDGPLAAVAGVRPEAIAYPPGAEALPDVWLEARSQLRSVLENVTFADLVRRSRARAGRLEPSAASDSTGA